MPAGPIYVPINFVDDSPPGSGTPLIASNFNHMEDGIANAVPKPTSPVTNGAMIWDGSGWVSAKIVDANVTSIDASKITNLPSGGFIGQISASAGPNTPADHVPCVGTSYLRSGETSPGSMNALYAEIGIAYGFADGSHFYVPDIRGRMVVGKGTHADIDALGEVEPGSLPVGSRRPRHNTSKNGSVTVGGGPWYFNFPGGSFFQAYTGGAGYGGSTSSANISDSTTFGPQTGAEPTDTPAYVVVNFFIRYR